MYIAPWVGFGDESPTGVDRVHGFKGGESISDAQRDLFVEFDASTKSAVRSLMDLDKTVDGTKANVLGIGGNLDKIGATFNTKMKSLDKDFALWEKNAGKFATTMERKQRQIGLVTDKASLLEQEIGNTVSELYKATKEYGANSEAVARLKNDLKDLQIEQQGYNEELKKLNGFDWDKLNKIGDGFTDVGKKLSLGVTAPLTAIGGLGLKTFTELEDSWIGVAKVTDGTTEQLANLRQEMNDLVTTGGVPLSVTEMYDIGAAAGQLGIGIDAMKEFSETSAQLGLATNMSSVEAATSLAQFSTVMQTSDGNFDRLGATLVGLGNNFATTESDIMRMTERLAGAGNTIGLTEAEVMGFATGFSALGINAEAGGTAFSKIMLGIQDSVMRGDDTLALFANIADSSVEDFAEKFRTDGAGAITDFMEGLGKLTEAGYNTTELFDDLGMSGINVSDLLRRTAGAGDTVRSAVEVANKSWEENTALTNEAGMRYEATSAKIQTFKNRVTLLSEKIGGDLQDNLVGIINIGNKAVGWLSNLDDNTRKNVVGFGMFVAAIGPTLLGIGTGIKLFIRMNDTVKTLGTTFKAVKGSFSAGGKAIGFFTSPIGLAVLAIGALIAVGVLLCKNWDKITAFFEEKFPSAFETVKNVILGIKGFLSDNTEIFKSIFTGFTDFISGIFTGNLEKAFGGLHNIVDNVATLFLNLIAPLEDKFPAGFAFLTSTIENFRTTAHNIIEGVQGIFEGFAMFFKGVFTGDMGLVFDGLGLIFTSGFDILQSIASFGFNGILDLAQLLISPLEEKFPALFNFLSSTIEGFRSNAETIMSGAKQVFDGLITFITGVFTGNWGKALEGVVGIFSGIFGTIGELAKAPINSVISSINGAISGINGINIKLPFSDKSFGVNIPSIPMLAVGTDNHIGGPAIVGEEGPELVNMPRGSTVTPNGETNRILSGLGRANRNSVTNDYIKGTSDSGQVTSLDTGLGANLPPQVKVVIEKIVLGSSSDGSSFDSQLTALKAELKAMFEDIFGDLWEEYWYKLTLTHPNITQA